MSRKTYLLPLLFALVGNFTWADVYKIDTERSHAFIQFKIKHLGYSWLYGRFNRFEGWFSYDENNLESSSAQVTIDTGSLDSNHAERDKHLRSNDFLDVKKYPQAKFISTGVTVLSKEDAVLHGELTFHGVTRPIDLIVKQIGTGPDPWGGYRRGFEGTTSFALKDYGITTDLGPASAIVELILSVEGIRQ